MTEQISTSMKDPQASNGDEWLRRSSDWVHDRYDDEPDSTADPKKFPGNVLLT